MFRQVAAECCSDSAVNFALSAFLMLTETLLKREIENGRDRENEAGGDADLPCVS